MTFVDGLRVPGFYDGFVGRKKEKSTSYGMSMLLIVNYNIIIMLVVENQLHLT